MIMDIPREDDNRTIKVKRLDYENSILFCNLILERKMKPEDMKKNKARGSLTIVGLTKEEAKIVRDKLDEVLKDG